MVVGAATSQVTKRIDEPTIEITLTVLAAYASFVAAEHYHVSGVIATVTGGMVCGNCGRKYGMLPTTRMALQSVSEYVAFGLNSVVFLLIGLDVALESLAESRVASCISNLETMAIRSISWPKATRVKRQRTSPLSKRQIVCDSLGETRSALARLGYVARGFVGP